MTTILEKYRRELRNGVKQEDARDRAIARWGFYLPLQEAVDLRPAFRWLLAREAERVDMDSQPPPAA